MSGSCRPGQALALFLPHAQLVATQVVVEGLHIGEDALGVWLLPHDHHVFHLHQGHAVCQHPVETQASARLGGLPLPAGGWDGVRQRWVPLSLDSPCPPCPYPTPPAASEAGQPAGTAHPAVSVLPCHPHTPCPSSCPALSACSHPPAPLGIPALLRQLMLLPFWQRAARACPASCCLHNRSRQRLPGCRGAAGVSLSRTALCSCPTAKATSASRAVLGPSPAPASSRCPSAVSSTPSSPQHPAPAIPQPSQCPVPPHALSWGSHPARLQADPQPRGLLAPLGQVQRGE